MFDPLKNTSKKIKRFLMLLQLQMAIQSKLTPIPSTCIQYVHPWTDSCSIATAGLILQAAQDSFRIYSAVYTV